MTVKIRKAHFRDIPGIVDLAKEAHAASAYKDASISPENIKLIARQTVGSGWLPKSGSVIFVSEGPDGIEGIFLGVVMQMYECLDMVIASNHFWYVREAGSAISGFALLTAFEGWVKDHFDRGIFRIGLSQAINGTDRLENVMKRGGYLRAGVTVEKEF